MKKLLLILCLVTSVSLFSCSKGETNKDIQDKKLIQEDVNSDKISSPKSDDLYSFEIVLNGVDYNLPIAFSELEKNGWVIKEADLINLEPSQHTLGTILKNGDKEINSYIFNSSENVQSADKCIVGGIAIDEYYAENGLKLVLPKGITLGSSKEEVLSAYGEPTDSYESELYTKFTYEVNTYKTIDIMIDIETNKVSQIDLRNFNDSPDKTNSSESANSNESISKSSTYKSPKELTDDLLSFNVKYDGVLYNVPVPFAELEKDGWVIESAPYEKIDAKDTAFGFILRKGNISLDTNLYNELDTSTSYKNCLVTSLISNDTDTKLPIELPKGIKVGSTQQDVESAFSNLEVVKEDDPSYISYTYTKTVLQEISIFISKETSKVYKIEVQYLP
ncbi:hypothetical protein [Clostridium gasigenes]|uniref:hypothetical protein n=1 Tax=Clostridium gasigenes TaxID=94869 RepID=UPI001C0E84BF|nr:hypothetical protein [Clostridium gasigenes]MBU3102706.1 hypothetical protein [Clostridium gasigenes]